MPKRKPESSTHPSRGKTAKRGRGSARRAKGASATKTQTCLDLLSRPNGATLEEMQEATGWQPHSVRGLLAGKIKKMAGLNLTSEKPGDGPRRYNVRAA
jgi:hypothetical protein